jgi:hypothetical protein
MHGVVRTAEKLIESTNKWQRSSWRLWPDGSYYA